MANQDPFASLLLLTKGLICLPAQCLLDNLLLSKDEHGKGLSLQSLRDQLMTLLVAGQETSAILLGWTVAFLACHPDVQEKAAAEVRDVLQGADPTPDTIRYRMNVCRLLYVVKGPHV